MPSTDVMQIVIYAALLLLLSPPLGHYMAKIFEGKQSTLLRPLQKCEYFLYRLCGVDRTQDMNARQYAFCVLFVSILGFLLTFSLQLLQKSLPLNPMQLPNVAWPLAINTAISFVTNTNWQAYSGESTMSYLTQAFALCVQNFISAAMGIAVLLAFTRGLVRKNTSLIGNFWVDMTRSILYVLVPLSCILALLLVSQGVVQNLNPATNVTTLEQTQQVLPMGPAASQIAIKQLGTNGGGFFGQNSAHPFENPTPLSNFLQMLAILLLPSALVFMFGSLIGKMRHAMMIYSVMVVIFTLFLGAGLYAEWQSNKALAISSMMEGKEQRFGITNSILWSTATTAASNGSVNAMHDSLSPLAGGSAIFLMLLGEIVFGGVGSGLYGMLLFVLLTVFLTGLMVGRTPEYLQKKLDAYDMRMAIIAIILPSGAVLCATAIALLVPSALESLHHAGPHGLSELLYAFASASNNNGSAFAGLNANTTFYNLLLALCMLIGRYGVIFPVLAIAGSLATKKLLSASNNSLSTDNATFASLLLGIIVLVAALTFMPVLSLGPLIEHALMQSGHLF